MAGGAGIAVAAGFQIVGNLLQARAAREAAAYDARMEEHLAAVALQDGEYEAWLQGMAGSQQEAQGAAALSAGGVDTSKGSPATVISNNRFTSAVNVAAIRLSAQRAAWTHRQRAAALRRASKANLLADVMGAGAIAASAYGQYSAIGRSPTANGVGSGEG